MRTVGWVMGIVLLAPAVSFAAEGDRVDPLWLEKIKTDGTASYKKYVAVAAGIEEEFETRVEKISGGGTSAAFHASTRRVRLVRAGENTLVDETRVFNAESGKGNILLACENKDYSFTLSKFQADSAYALASYTPGQQDSLKQSWTGLHLEAFFPFRDVLFAVEGRDKNALRGVEWDGGKGLLKIRTTFAADNGLIPQDLWVDPARGWRVVEVSRVTPTLRYVTRVSYGREVGGVEFPTESHTTTTYTVPNAPPNHVIITRLKSIRITDKTDADFRLSAFGLPEPVGIEPLPKRTPRYVWFLAVAGACAVLAVLFRWLARRRRSDPTSPAPPATVT